MKHADNSYLFQFQTPASCQCSKDLRKNSFCVSPRLPEETQDQYRILPAKNNPPVSGVYVYIFRNHSYFHSSSSEWIIPRLTSHTAHHCKLLYVDGHKNADLRSPLSILWVQLTRTFSRAASLGRYGRSGNSADILNYPLGWRSREQGSRKQKRCGEDSGGQGRGRHRR